MQSFTERLANATRLHGPLCVGLDPHLHLLPEPYRERCLSLSTPSGRQKAADSVHEWSLIALQSMTGEVGVIKPQIALYEQLGSAGLAALEDIVARAKKAGLLVLMDAKRGDIGSTAEAYARALLDNDGPFGADAVTLSPYLGRDSLAPFVKRCGNGEKGVFILLRTSNPGGKELQKEASTAADVVAGWVTAWNSPLMDANGLGPVGVVVGATLGQELIQWRHSLDNAWFLMPGYGAQGASAVDCRAGFRKDGLGALINSSRGVLFAGPNDQEAYNESPGSVIRSKIEAAKSDLKSAQRAH